MEGHGQAAHVPRQLSEVFEEALDAFLQILDIQVDPEGLGPFLFGNLETLDKTASMGSGEIVREGTGYMSSSGLSWLSLQRNLKRQVLRPKEGTLDLLNPS